MQKVEYRQATKEELEETVSVEAQPFFLQFLESTISFFADDRLIAVGGVTRLSNTGTGEVWLSVRQEFSRYLAAPASVRSALRALEKRMKLNRYQMSTKASKPTHARFAFWLGYQHEGLLRAYVSGEDYFIFSHIPGRP